MRSNPKPEPRNLEPPMPRMTPGAVDRMVDPELRLAPMVRKKLMDRFINRSWEHFRRLQQCLPTQTQRPGEQAGRMANLWLRAQEIALEEITLP